MVKMLLATTDKGFEDFCAHLLRHIGFEDVKVTGKAGDQGIDGEGYLIVNRFVRTKVMFQCKRYTKTSIPNKEIRDFRGAIQGRAERGIFFTTSTFTKQARGEAARENVTAIELVDLNGLLQIMIEESLGVKEAKALQVNKSFFDIYLTEDVETITPLHPQLDPTTPHV